MPNLPADEFGYALVVEYPAGTQLGWHRDVLQFEACMLKDEACWRWQHSIAPTTDLRYSITFRTRRKTP